MNEPYTTRIEKVDFFASVPPGFYAFGSVSFMLVSVFDGRDPMVVWQWAFGGEHRAIPAWALGIGAVFVSYLFGSILRSFPVDDLDSRCGFVLRHCVFPLRRCRLRFGRHGLVFRWAAPRRLGSPPQTRHMVYDEEFPFWGCLRNTLNTVRRYHVCVPEIEIPEKTKASFGGGFASSRRLLHFWRMVLCQEEPQAFAHIQSQEALSRYFAGMIRASLVSTICAAVALRFSNGPWHLAGWVLLAVSALALVMFAVNFRFVRYREARDIFLSYLAWTYIKKTQRATWDRPC